MDVTEVDPDIVSQNLYCTTLSFSQKDEYSCVFPLIKNVIKCEYVAFV